MKKAILIFVAIVMMAGFSNSVIAQTENTEAGAVIIKPITIAEESILHFGVMAVNAAGTCVLSTGGVRTQTGGVVLAAQTPVATNAAYTVTGEPTFTYAITLPGSITVTKPVTLETMTIGTLLAKSTSGLESNTATGTIEAGGTETFTVGGTLTVDADQVAGAYAGTFDVTVAYN